MPLTETAIYSPEVYDGIYVADHELYNGKKCYRNSANQRTCFKKNSTICDHAMASIQIILIFQPKKAIKSYGN